MVTIIQTVFYFPFEKKPAWLMVTAVEKVCLFFPYNGNEFRGKMHRNLIL